MNEDVGLVTYLKQDLADAIACQDCTMIARISETLNTFEKLSSARYDLAFFIFAFTPKRMLTLSIHDRG